jgi:hypothetical protein
MKCGHCKRNDNEVNVAHVRICSQQSDVAPVRTWQENKAVAVAKVLGSSPVDVPAGRYAIDHGNGVVKFFRVDKPTEGKWAGYTFVKRQASDDEFPVRNRVERDSILATIAVDVVAASKLYGTTLGVCGVCGRTLTDATSRAAGIGPVCAAKF